VSRDNPECLTPTCGALTPARYWRIRAALSAVELAQERARAIVAPAQAVLAEAMRQAGLNPHDEYRLDDATEAVMLVSPEGHRDA
jgi:hypothetical protein